MEPISTAMAAFSVVSAGIKAGRDLGSLAKPLGQLFDGIDDAKGKHNKKKRSPFSSANEEALSTFIAKTQAEDLEEELRDIIINTRGISAWHQLVALRTQIRVDRKKEEEEQIKKREEFREALTIWLLGGFIFFGIIGSLVLFVAWRMGKL